MAWVNYYECDKCGKRLTQEQESEGAISLSSGSTCASLCVDCQGTTTVLESKQIARRVLAVRTAAAKHARGTNG